MVWGALAWRSCDIILETHTRFSDFHPQFHLRFPFLFAFFPVWVLLRQLSSLFFFLLAPLPYFSRTLPPFLLPSLVPFQFPKNSSLFSYRLLLFPSWLALSSSLPIPFFVLFHLFWLSSSLSFTLSPFPLPWSSFLPLSSAYLSMFAFPFTLCATWSQFLSSSSAVFPSLSERCFAKVLQFCLSPSLYIPAHALFNLRIASFFSSSFALSPFPLSALLAYLPCALRLLAGSAPGFSETWKTEKIKTWKKTWGLKAWKTLEDLKTWRDLKKLERKNLKGHIVHLVQVPQSPWVTSCSSVFLGCTLFASNGFLWLDVFWDFRSMLAAWITMRAPLPNLSWSFDVPGFRVVYQISSLWFGGNFLAWVCMSW